MAKRSWALLFFLWLSPFSSAAAGSRADANSLLDQMVPLGAKDQFPAMTNPDFVDPTGIDYLADSDLVLGVYLNGTAKAYPENLGWWHEVINDQVAGQYISVTFCPLTGTGLNFDATAPDGSQIEYGVSGLLLNSNLVLYDRRDSRTLYPQMLFTGLSGDFEGEQLELLPVIETTWGLWKALHPDTKVAVGGTGLDYYSADVRANYPAQAYREDPYVEYRQDNTSIPFPTIDNLLDQRFPAKAIVLGLCNNNETKAYPFSKMGPQAVINDIIGNLFVVILFDGASQTAIPYKSAVNGEALAFYQVASQSDLPLEFMDANTGSRWNMLGEAIAGPLQGAKLEQLPAYNAMWFAWLGFWPDTQVWSGEGRFDQLTTVAQIPAPAAPQSFGLDQNYPNPFNPTTHIQYRLASAQQVRLGVFNSAGQLVRILLDGHRPAGTHQTGWDGRDQRGRAMASGHYFYRLEVERTEFNQTRSMLLLR